MLAPVITVSDEVAEGRDENRAGPLAVVLLAAQGVQAELAAAGLTLTHWWTDAAGDFALSLSTKP